MKREQGAKDVFTALRDCHKRTGKTTDKESNCEKNVGALAAASLVRIRVMWMNLALRRSCARRKN